MPYFTDDYLQFFKDLAGNNHKLWFDTHRKHYETQVREPFKRFITDLIHEIQKTDASIQLEAKDAIFRINRDTRFSKDKTPYKLFNSAVISPMGRKDKSLPGMYLEFNPEYITISGGIYNPDTEQVRRIRAYLTRHFKAFESIIHQKDFRSLYGEIKGKQNKRLPKEYQLLAEKIPVLYNKQWYYESRLSPEILTKNHLMDTIMRYYHIGFPVQKFLRDALKESVSLA